MGRSFPKSRRIERSGAKSSGRKTIYIFCEGKTEKDYIEKFTKNIKTHNLIINTIGRVGVPLTVVRSGVQKSDELKLECKRDKIKFSDYYRVYCLSDVDEHPNISEAKVLAVQNGIYFILSNPCFELWGLLHYHRQDAFIHRHALQRELSRRMNGYHHDKNPLFDQNEIKDLYGTAKTNSETIRKWRKEQGNEGGNPSTSVDELMEVIINGTFKAEK